VVRKFVEPESEVAAGDGRELKIEPMIAFQCGEPPRSEYRRLKAQLQYGG
jgi:hypothetical protein